MTTSDLLSRMYPLPSKALSEQSTRLMQKLHTMPASRPTETSAPNGRCSSGSGPISTSCTAPYLHRVCWLLNRDGLYLTQICGTTLQWDVNADAVPPEHRFSSFSHAKTIWLRLKEINPAQADRLSIRPVDFYAHRSTPHLWCACDD